MPLDWLVGSDKLRLSKLQVVLCLSRSSVLGSLERACVALVMPQTDSEVTRT